MSDNPVLWSEMEKYCSDRQHQCHALMDQKQETHALRIETERRTGMVELQTTLEALRVEVQTIKTMFTSHAVWMLPKPILYLLCAGMAGIGAAGKELGALILSWFGVKVGG